jgi:hypothetical protein
MSCDCEDDTDEDGDEETYELKAGAGWMTAEAEAQSPDEAYELWERAWERMLSDVEAMTEKERERAGVRR